jgi:hypothetical protein
MTQKPLRQFNIYIPQELYDALDRVRITDGVSFRHQATAALLRYCEARGALTPTPTKATTGRRRRAA